MEKITTLVDNGTEFQGRLIFDGVARIDGLFRGEVFATDTVIIGPEAVVHADIEAGMIIISGQVHGNMKMDKKVVIKPTGRLLGNISAPRLLIEEGGVFIGGCSMGAGQKDTL